MSPRTTDQLELFPLEPTDAAGTMAERFEAFHRANPHVLRAIVQVARELQRSGMARAGISLIFERLRWLWVIQTGGSDDYRLNNNWRAYYSRLAGAVAPDLVGFFRIRQQTDEWSPYALASETCSRLIPNNDPDINAAVSALGY